MLHFQLSVRRKIILVVVLLSFMILAFGAYVAVSTLQTVTGREGRFLRVAFERFRNQLEAAGSQDETAAMLIASDPALQAELVPAEPIAEEKPAKVEKDKGDKADKG